MPSEPTPRALGLTKVHNQLKQGEPKALRKAYEAMNEAVCLCYGWPKDTWQDQLATLDRLLALNRELSGLGELLG